MLSFAKKDMLWIGLNEIRKSYGVVRKTNFSALLDLRLEIRMFSSPLLIDHSVQALYASVSAYSVILHSPKHVEKAWAMNHETLDFVRSLSRFEIDALI